MKLKEIKVGEVSLVDKAANKRRWLLYKRDDGSETPEEILKTAAPILDGLMEILKSKDDRAHNQEPDYAKQAKDLLMGKFQQVYSYCSDEEKAAIAKAMGLEKVATPPKDDKAKDEELEFSDEEIKTLQSLDAAVNSLQQELADSK